MAINDHQESNALFPDEDVDKLVDSAAAELSGLEDGAECALVNKLVDRISAILNEEFHRTISSPLQAASWLDRSQHNSAHLLFLLGRQYEKNKVADWDGFDVGDITVDDFKENDDGLEPA